MGWIQVTKPNTDDKTLYVKDSNGRIMTDWCGWCLAVVQQAYGITERKYASAIECWNRNQNKQTDRMELPIGDFIVPAFFSGGKYGHVIMIQRLDYDKCRIWSSPYNHKPYFYKFEGGYQAGIADIEKKFGVKYLGFTYTLTGTRILEWIGDPVEAKAEEKKQEAEQKKQEEEPKKQEVSDEKSDVIIKLTHVLQAILDFAKSLIGK